MNRGHPGRHPRAVAGRQPPRGRLGPAAAAHLLWLPYALAASQPGFALAVAAFGLICFRNYRNGHLYAGLHHPRRNSRS